MSLEFNWSNLPMRLQQKIKKLKRLGAVTETRDGPLIYIDNGAKILGVAHMDAVGFTPVKFNPTRWDQRALVNAMQLDDRLGVCILLDILPQLGLKYDILLCDSEECARSTAAYFLASKDYNWMFEFDRAGTDVVMYDYETQEHRDLLEDYGFTVGFGSFTDICKLEHLRCAGFNFGCGYHMQHTKSCCVDLLDTEYMIKKFADFYDDIHDTYLEHDPTTSTSRWAGKSSLWPQSDGWSKWTGTSSSLTRDEWDTLPSAKRSQLPIGKNVYTRMDQPEADSWKYREDDDDLLSDTWRVKDRQKLLSVMGDELPWYEQDDEQAVMDEELEEEFRDAYQQYINDPDDTEVEL